VRRSLGKLGELDAEVANKVKQSTGTDVGDLKVELRPDLVAKGRRAVAEQGVGIGVACDDVLQDSMTLAHEAIHSVQQRGGSEKNEQPPSEEGAQATAGGKKEAAALDAEVEAVRGAQAALGGQPFTVRAAGGPVLYEEPGDEAVAETTANAEGVAEGAETSETPDFSKMTAEEMGAVEFWSLKGVQREAYFSRVESLDSQEFQVLVPLLEANRVVEFYRRLFPAGVMAKEGTTSMRRFVEALGALSPKQRSVLFEALTPVDLGGFVGRPGASTFERESLERINEFSPEELESFFSSIVKDADLGRLPLKGFTPSVGTHLMEHLGTRQVDEKTRREIAKTLKTSATERAANGREFALQWVSAEELEAVEAIKTKDGAKVAMAHLLDLLASKLFHRDDTIEVGVQADGKRATDCHNTSKVLASILNSIGVDAEVMSETLTGTPLTRDGGHSYVRFKDENGDMWAIVHGDIVYNRSRGDSLSAIEPLQDVKQYWQDSAGAQREAADSAHETFKGGQAQTSDLDTLAQKGLTAKEAADEVRAWAAANAPDIVWGEFSVPAAEVFDQLPEGVLVYLYTPSRGFNEPRYPTAIPELIELAGKVRSRIEGLPGEQAEVAARLNTDSKQLRPSTHEEAKALLIKLTIRLASEQIGTAAAAQRE